MGFLTWYSVGQKACQTWGRAEFCVGRADGVVSATHCLKLRGEATRTQHGSVYSLCCSASSGWPTLCSPVARRSRTHTELLLEHDSCSNGCKSCVAANLPALSYTAVFVRSVARRRTGDPNYTDRSPRGVDRILSFA